MRFTTFNLNGGSVRDAITALSSDEVLATGIGTQPGDFLALQEVTRYEDSESCIHSTGPDVKQLAFKYSGTANRGPKHEEGSPSIAAECEVGGEKFRVLVLWAKPNPTYQLDIMRSLDFYSSWIAAQPTVVLGDFNLDPKVRGTGTEFYVANARLNELGLFSAYHWFHNIQYGHEPNPTLLFNWGKGPRSGCFHCDLIYVPHRWLGRIASVVVEPVFGLHNFTDHRAVTATIT